MLHGVQRSQHNARRGCACLHDRQGNHLKHESQREISKVKFPTGQLGNDALSQSHGGQLLNPVLPLCTNRFAQNYLFEIHEALNQDVGFLEEAELLGSL